MSGGKQGAGSAPGRSEARAAAVRPSHGVQYRPETAIPVGAPFKPGRFGRMFPLPMRRPIPPAALAELAQTMVEDTAAGFAAEDNPDIPAAYTYLGQFVDHDITFDTTPVPEQIVDPTMVRNFRTPALDLDSIYGLGPGAQPYLYQASNQAKLALGKNADSVDQNRNPIQLPGEGQFDLPRNADGFALIGDPRNDENLVVSQLHLAFLKFHNAVADAVEPDPAKQPAAFDEIRRTVTWHYQWIVLHDFLKRVAQPAAVDDVLQNGRRHYHFQEEPYIPVEFSVAAYRFGHSMIRNGYDHNRVFGPGPGRLGPGSLELLFFFTGPAKTNAIGIKSSPLPSNWIIDWNRFLDVKGGTAPANPSRLMDTHLAAALHDLVKNLKVGAPPTSLAERNLRRGEAVALPTGQSVAYRLRVPALTPGQIAEAGKDGEVAAKHGLHESTPLWFYVLKEAAIQEKGRRLGAVGSRLLAEVFVGLLEGDPLSFLTQNPGWKPELPGRQAGHFTLADMLNFVEKSTPAINPLGA